MGPGRWAPGAAAGPGINARASNEKSLLKEAQKDVSVLSRLQPASFG
jgi:hypothetical protein